MDKQTVVQVGLVAVAGYTLWARWPKLFLRQCQNPKHRWKLIAPRVVVTRHLTRDGLFSNRRRCVKRLVCSCGWKGPESEYVARFGWRAFLEKHVPGLGPMPLGFWWELKCNSVVYWYERSRLIKACRKVLWTLSYIGSSMF
jgi:hypothetical protein